MILCGFALIVLSGVFGPALGAQPERADKSVSGNLCGPGYIPDGDGCCADKDRNVVCDPREPKRMDPVQKAGDEVVTTSSIFQAASTTTRQAQVSSTNRAASIASTSTSSSTSSTLEASTTSSSSTSSTRKAVSTCANK